MEDGGGLGDSGPEGTNSVIEITGMPIKSNLPDIGLNLSKVQSICWNGVCVKLWSTLTTVDYG